MIQRFQYINHPVVSFNCRGQEESRSIDNLNKLINLIRGLRRENEALRLKMRMPIQWVPQCEYCELVLLSNLSLKDKRLYPCIAIGGEANIEDAIYALADLGDLYYFLNRATARSYRLEVDDCVFRLDCLPESGVDS